MPKEKRALVIINPYAGQRMANRHLTSVVEVLSSEGYLPTVLTTTVEENGSFLVREYGKSADLYVCIGGDGTFHEVVAGVLDVAPKTPIAYIPAGTTNDFAKSIGLPTSIPRATALISDGLPCAIDIGTFNNEYFTYTASCGAFTRASYATPRAMKNSLGHLAYVLESIRSLPELRPVHLRIETEERVYEDDYIFTAVCNSTSLGGVLRLKPEAVDLQDGQLEFLLIRAPKTMMEFTKIVQGIQAKRYEPPLMTLFSAASAKIYTPPALDWSLDGEHVATRGTVEISAKRLAFKLLLPKDAAKRLKEV